MRVTRKGKPLKPFEVPIDGPVTGIAIGKYDRVWVDNGRTAVLLRRDGSQVGTLTHGPGDLRKKPGRPDRYGGIDAFGKTVFIANRCERTVEIFRRTGKRLAVLRPRGPGYPRGVAYLPGPRRAARPALRDDARPRGGARLRRGEGAHRREAGADGQGAAPAGREAARSPRVWSSTGSRR